MANLNMNKIILGGRLTQNPELKQTQSDMTYLRFTVAVNRRTAKDADSNQPTVDFINCIAWKQAAENIAKFFQKGSCICVVGRLQIGSYEKDGVKRSTADVVVDEFYFVDGKNDNKTESSAPAAQPKQDTSAPKVEVIENDDLPF